MEHITSHDMALAGGITSACTAKQLKAGGEIPQKGKRITVSVKNKGDLSRDVIKVNLFIKPIRINFSKLVLFKLSRFI